MMVKQLTKYCYGVETTATVLHKGAGLHEVTVTHRFDSGNFVTVTEPKVENLSLVAALGLAEFYTR